MYRCTRCKATFEEPAVYEEGTISMSSDHYYYELRCPKCGEDELEEVNECKLCGEPTADDYSYYCDDCHTNLGLMLRSIANTLHITAKQLEEMIDEHYQKGGS